MKHLSHLFNQLDSARASVELVSGLIHQNLKGKDVVIHGRGKYKGRYAQIQSFTPCLNGDHHVHVYIYRKDGRTGFKGKEKFIDDHTAEYMPILEVELL